MKRYVKEFARDLLKRVQSYPEGPEKAEQMEKIPKVVEAADRGIISDFQAIRVLCGYYDK